MSKQSYNVNREKGERELKVVASTILSLIKPTIPWESHKQLLGNVLHVLLFSNQYLLRFWVISSNYETNYETLTYIYCCAKKIPHDQNLLIQHVSTFTNLCDMHATYCVKLKAEFSEHSHFSTVSQFFSLFF